MYQVDRITLPMREDGEAVPLDKAALCGKCGYMHISEGAPPDRCVSCNEILGIGCELTNLLEMKTVHTRRRDRITSNEEERRREVSRFKPDTHSPKVNCPDVSWTGTSMMINIH